MRRRLFTILSAVSALLFVATCVLWVRSYRRSDRVFFSHGDSGTEPTALKFYLEVADGDFLFRRVVYFVHRDYEIPLNSPGGKNYNWSWGSDDNNGSLLPFSIEWGGNRLSDRAFIVPIWALTWGCSILPSAWLFHRAVGRRFVGGEICDACGYDLRATLNRCPECGTLAKSKPAPNNNPAISNDPLHLR